MRDLARVPSKIAPAVARDIGREIQKQMDAGKDPYGKSWRRKADGSQSRLLKTGRGRASIKVLPLAGAGIRIVVFVLYMIYHQFGGASHLRGPGGSYRMRKKNKNFGRDKDQSSGRNHPPKRSFLPWAEVPRAWGEIVLGHLEAAAKKVVRRA